jgi:hypothetical protein
LFCYSAAREPVHLIQRLLPLYDNAGTAFPRALLDRVREELAERFGGVTAYLRSPAHGVWKEGGEEEHDDIVIFEVMAERLERPWWREYRAELERRFRQDEVVIRASAIERL